MFRLRSELKKIPIIFWANYEHYKKTEKVRTLN